MIPEYASIANSSDEKTESARCKPVTAADTGDETTQGDGGISTARRIVRSLSSVSGKMKPHQYIDDTGTASHDEDDWLGKEELEPLNDEEKGEANKSRHLLLRSKSSSSGAGLGGGQNPPPLSEQNCNMSFSTYASIITFASGGEDDEDAERTGWKNNNISVISDFGDVKAVGIGRTGVMQVVFFLVLIVMPFVLLQGALLLVKYLSGDGERRVDGVHQLMNSTEIVPEI